jgi:sec-independent protein translocase protein TatC
MSDIDDTRAPLMDHLIELRSRLIWSMVALGLAFGVCLFFVKPIYGLLLAPLKHIGQNDLYSTGVFEPFFTRLKIAFFAALMLAFPIISNQLWRFVAPGLYKHEKDAFRPFLMMTPLLFTLGAALAYYVAMPIALRYLFSFQGDLGGVNQKILPTALDYLKFATTFIFGFGVAFQLPVLLLILERAGIVTRDQLAKGRRYAVVASTGLAALLTPPDLFSMLLLAIPLIVLYEIALLVMLLSARKRAPKTETEHVD